MVRALAATIAAAAALHLLAALHGASAARPMGRQATASGTATTMSVLALAPAGHHQRRGAAAAARAGKWLPFAGMHHHLPVAAAYWAHKPVPWVGAGELAGAGAGAGAVEGGEEEEEETVRERERERPSYEGDGTTTRRQQRQEQLAMWASLLNPKGKGRTATGWLPGPATGEAAEDEPAKAADTVEGAEVDDPAADGARVGQTYWGNNGN